MDDAELLRQALEALKEPALNSIELQHRIAARLAEIYGHGGPKHSEDQSDGDLDASIPILRPGR